MTVPIQTLIDRPDNFEVIRDQIAAILVAESTSQQALAVTAGKPDPTLWKLRVFTERSDPWAEYAAPEEGGSPPDPSPIVCVSYDNSTFETASSNVVETQTAIGTFNVDCYGYGVSAATSGGHLPGDQAAALVAQRAARLARSILMADSYTYLGLRGTVGQRWPSSVTMIQPTENDRPVERVAAARIAFSVRFLEFSPQYVPKTLTSIYATVKRAENGQVFLVEQFP